MTEPEELPRMRRIFRTFTAGNAETLERVLNNDCEGWEILQILSSNDPNTSPYVVVCVTRTVGVGGFIAATIEETRQQGEQNDQDDEKAAAEVFEGGSLAPAQSGPIDPGPIDPRHPTRTPAPAATAEPVVEGQKDLDAGKRRGGANSRRRTGKKGA